MIHITFRRCMEKNSKLIRFLAWNPYLKRDGASHLIIFSVKRSKTRIHLYFFYISFQSDNIDLNISYAPEIEHNTTSHFAEH